MEKFGVKIKKGKKVIYNLKDVDGDFLEVFVNGKVVFESTGAGHKIVGGINDRRVR